MQVSPKIATIAKQRLGTIHHLAKQLGSRHVNIMEVCGTHTMSVYRHGIKQLLPKNVHLLSGPGCPVCVTPTGFVDAAIELSKKPEVILTTFGDMLKVPGSKSSLAKEKGNGADVRIVYSPLNSLEVARDNPNKKVIFLGVGFETTAPTIGATVLLAEKEGLTNFFVLSSHKVMPPPMKILVEAKEVHIDGFLCPGHVSAITGAKIFEFLAKEYHIPCVIAGFEPLDILESIEMLLNQILMEKSAIEIQYSRCVTWEGNLKAQHILETVFEPEDAEWRGLGIVPGSGLKLSKEYQAFDSLVYFQISLPPSVHIPGCICGDVLRGISKPGDCRLFRKVCTPENPIGPCMVSSEGTCAAYYKYEKNPGVHATQ